MQCRPKAVYPCAPVAGGVLCCVVWPGARVGRCGAAAFRATDVVSPSVAVILSRNTGCAAETLTAARAVASRYAWTHHQSWAGCRDAAQPTGVPEGALPPGWPCFRGCRGRSLVARHRVVACHQPWPQHAHLFRLRSSAGLHPEKLHVIDKGRTGRTEQNRALGGTACSDTESARNFV